MTKTILTIQEISNHFNKFNGYISNPPEKQTLGWVYHFIDKSSYESIINKFGIRYLLIVIHLLEYHEEYEECQEAVKTITEYNKKYKTNHPTHIREVNSIY